MDEKRGGTRMKPPVFFPGMGSPKENEIRRMELDASALNIRARGEKS